MQRQIPVITALFQSFHEYTSISIYGLYFNVLFFFFFPSFPLADCSAGKIGIQTVHRTPDVQRTGSIDFAHHHHAIIPANA